MSVILKELRLLPPMVIARFGSSPTPMDNYELHLPVDGAGKATTGFRRIVPSETLLIDPEEGGIVASTVPGEIRFRDAEGRIKPVSPFLEVWALFEGADEFVPLTQEHLGDLQVSTTSLVWRVRAANLKPFRRTGDPRDKVESDTGPFSDHAAHPLVGFCPNFKPGKSIKFGTARYLRPTPDFPELRFRFTPGAGLVFGPRAGDPLLADDVYGGSTSGDARIGGLPRGRWDRYFFGNADTPPVTAPADIFQGENIGVNGDTKLSHGYFDDTCDGIVTVSLTIGGTTFSAYARFASAVPDFAPDSLPVRSICDDIEQMAFGPTVPKPSTNDEKAVIKGDVEDIIRRALDTVRQMNTAVMNGNEPIADVVRYRNNMPGQEAGSYNRAFEPIFPASQARYSFVIAIHKNILQRAIDSPDLEHAFQGSLGWVRQPEQVADLRTDARRRMPAMMRGNEGVELVLTRRQIAKLALADAPTPPPGAPSPAVALATSAKTVAPAPLDPAMLRRPIRRRVRSDPES